MDGARDQLLAAAVFAVDQHPGVGRRYPGHQFPDLLQALTAADHGEARVGGARQSLAQARVFALEAPVFQGPLHGHQQPVGVERLLEKVEGALLDRLHGSHDGPMS